MRFDLILFCSVLLTGLGMASASAGEPVPRPWMDATPENLPRWRGFNLLEKFNGRRQPFNEEDFRLISKLGFNFVRLPMDYRMWIKNGDWESFDESALAEIDQAVAWGEKYHIHVWINFHRAPGYTVARPGEKTSLWTDANTQRVCALHWATFARRYKGVSSTRLSFNLMNEPGDVEPVVYAAVVRKLVAAIRAEDPDRLIVSDGLKWGNQPIPELADLHIAQATRGYSPMEISHYRASWVNSADFPTPQWPRPIAPTGTLLGPSKKEGSFPLQIDGPFEQATQLRMHVMQVSSAAKLVVEADGVQVYEKQFQCGPGEGEWKKAEFTRYKTYLNLFDLDYEATIPAQTRHVRIRVASGDWLHISEIALKPASGKAAILELRNEWGKKPVPIRYTPAASSGPFSELAMQDRHWLWVQNIEPWKALESQGVGIMVGEWGAFNKTPQDVFLRWAEDCLSNWKQAGWGWAMWNFRGPFGILDSERVDVKYEDFEGHKLDRKLLELLQKY